MLFISGQRYYFILFSSFVVRRLNDKEIIKEVYRIARELEKMERVATLLERAGLLIADDPRGIPLG